MCKDEPPGMTQRDRAGTVRTGLALAAVCGLFLVKGLAVHQAGDPTGSIITYLLIFWVASGGGRPRLCRSSRALARRALAARPIRAGLPRGEPTGRETTDGDTMRPADERCATNRETTAVCGDDHATGLILYTQTGCADSDRVRSWLTERDVAFTERNASTDLEAAQALYATGTFATPLLVAGDATVLGFRPKELTVALDGARGGQADPRR